MGRKKTERLFKIKTCYCRTENKEKFYKKWTDLGWELISEWKDGEYYSIMKFRKDNNEENSKRAIREARQEIRK